MRFHSYHWTYFVLVSEEKKNKVPRKYYKINLNNICLYPSIKTFALSTRSFVFSMENIFHIVYEGERLLIHLVRPTTKEEKIKQYDMNTYETVLV